MRQHPPYQLEEIQVKKKILKNTDHPSGQQICCFAEICQDSSFIQHLKPFDHLEDDPLWIVPKEV